MADRLPKRPNPIRGSKRPALNCVKCYMWDSSGVSARPHVVRFVNQWPAKFSFLWHCFYVRGWHNRLLHWGHCWHRCYFTKQGFILTEQVVPRKLFNSPLGKVRSNRIEWVKHTRLLGVTIDDRLSWSKHLTDVRKSFVNKLNLLKRSSFLSRYSIGFAFSGYPTFSSIWPCRVGWMR